MREEPDEYAHLRPAGAAAMTPTQIRAKRKKLEKQMKDLDRQIEHIRVEMGALSSECEHPNEYATSCMGDPGTHCPDCGHST